MTEDSVARLQRYQLEHPEIVVVPPDSHNPLWEAIDPDGKVLAYGYWIKILLDKLESQIDQC
jgi:hypothetical protein